VYGVGITDEGDFMLDAIEMASYVIIYLPSFMKISSGVQEI
jgi:hypothetical protein